MLASQNAHNENTLRWQNQWVQWRTNKKYYSYKFNGIINSKTMESFLNLMRIHKHILMSAYGWRNCLQNSSTNERTTMNASVIIIFIGKQYDDDEVNANTVQTEIIAMQPHYSSHIMLGQIMIGKWFYVHYGCTIRN